MTSVDDFLEHYGVKGMKWGVQSGSTSGSGQSKQLAKADKKWEKNALKPKQYFKVYNQAANHMNTVGVDKINNKPEYKNANFNKTGWESPKGKRYLKEMEDEFTTAMDKAAVSVVGKSASGKSLKFKYDTEGSFPTAYVSDSNVKHSDEDVEIKIKWSAEGQITSFDFEEPLIQSDNVDDFFEHYGVKGMKWGVSRTESQIARSAPSTVNEKTKPALRGSQAINVKNKSGGRITTRGGKRNVATPDAVNAAVARQKAKKSTTNALSNKELKTAVERMNLEQQFSKLTKSDAKANRGKKFIDVFFKVGSGNLVGAAASAVSTTTAKQVPRRAIGG